MSFWRESIALSGSLRASKNVLLSVAEILIIASHSVDGKRFYLSLGLDFSKGLSEKVQSKLTEYVTIYRIIVLLVRL